VDPLDVVVAVIGTGPEACEIARTRARAGHVVRLYASDARLLASALDRIRIAVESAFRAGQLSPDDRQRTLDGIVATTDLDEAVAGANVVIDARDG
jgi:3-hydroxyacyl-CoA dehydrogenase